MKLESLNTRIDDEFDKKYGRVKSRGSSKIKAKLQFVSKIKTKLNRGRLRNYNEIYEEAKDNVVAALAAEKKLQTTALNDVQKAVVQHERGNYVDAVSENSEEAARLVDKMLKTSGEYSKNRVYKFVTRHPHVFKLDGQGNRKIKLQKNVFLRILTKMIPRYRKYESAKREEVKNQVMDRFDNLVEVRDNKLLGSQEGLDMLSKRNVVRTMTATLENDRDVIPAPKAVQFDGQVTSAAVPQSQPVAPVTPAAPAVSPTQSPVDFINSWKKEAPKVSSPTPTMESLISRIEALEKELEAEKAKNKQLISQFQSGVVSMPNVNPTMVAGGSEFQTILPSAPDMTAAPSYPVNGDVTSTPDYGSGHVKKF